MGSRYFIFMSYNGSSYHGWQVQPNSTTVQQIMEEALSTVLGETIEVTGAGRTDTGVHASFFCAHIDSNKDNLDGDMKLVGRLNSFLPKDIAISAIKKVDSGLHARFSAISRTYKYYIALKKSPFWTDYSWYLPKKLDVVSMNKACGILVRYSDFTSFSKLHTDVKTNNCAIYEAKWDVDGDMLVFTIKADRFLRNMVRAIVGTTVEVGLGKKSLEEFEKIIIAKNRCAAGQSVPAKGLFLVDIQY